MAYCTKPLSDPMLTYDQQSPDATCINVPLDVMIVHKMDFRDMIFKWQSFPRSQWGNNIIIAIVGEPVSY